MKCSCLMRRIMLLMAAALLLAGLPGSARADILYATSISNGTIVQVDTTLPYGSNITQTYSVGGEPDSLIFDSTGSNILWTNLGAGTVNSLNIGSKISSVLVPQTSTGSSFIQDLALSPGGASALVTLTDVGSAIKFGLPGGAVNGAFSMATGFSGPRGIVYDNLGNVFMVETSTGKIYQLDPTTGAVMKSISLGGALNIDGMTFDPVTGELWVANYAGLIEVPTSLSGFTNFTPTGASISYIDGIESDGKGNLYLADSGDGNILKYNIGTNVATIAALVPGLDDLAPVVGLGAPSSTPEPATITLFSFGIAGLMGYCWRRRRQQEGLQPS